MYNKVFKVSKKNESLFLKEVSSIKSDNTEAEKHFVDQTTKLYDFVLKADNVLDKITEYKDNWLAKLVVKIMK